MLRGTMNAAVQSVEQLNPDLASQAASPGERFPQERIRLALEGTLGVPFTDGNGITPYRNGNEIFPAMLAAIKAAEHRVEFLTFIYWTGDIAGRFVDAFVERAKAGVEVRVLLDGFGARPMRAEHIETMRAAGVDVQWFRPIMQWKLGQLDNRTHRKILVCDGVIGFTGGVGIATEWEGNAENPSHWRDTHFECRGPIVRALRAAFYQNWIEADFNLESALAPSGAIARQQDAEQSDLLVQVVASTGSPGFTDVAILHEVLALLARKRLRIVTPYFAPNEQTVRSLSAATKRGVEVEVMLPGPHADKRVSEFASAEVFDALLEAGVVIWRYQPTMLHTKLITIDGQLASIGSANFNQRSVSKDDEIVLNVLSPAFVAEMDEHFDTDRSRCERLTLGQWQRRGLLRRLAEAVLSPVKGQV
jgi:cardiolipin synthase